MTRHILKLHDKYFDAVLYGFKTFEIRKADRDYKVGDVLILNRIDDEGRISPNEPSIHRAISYILRHEDFPAGIQEGYVVLGIMSYQNRN